MVPGSYVDEFEEAISEKPELASYTKKLFDDKKLCISKVKEEIGELIEAVEEDSNKIHEAADVIYHLMVLLESNGIKIEDVMEELKKRQK